MCSLHNINDALLVVSLFVSDYLDAHPAVREWRRSNNRKPPFTDAEGVTMALMQGCLRLCHSQADLSISASQPSQRVSEGVQLSAFYCSSAPVTGTCRASCSGGTLPTQDAHSPLHCGQQTSPAVQTRAAWQGQIASRRRGIFR